MVAASAGPVLRRYAAPRRSCRRARAARRGLAPSTGNHGGSYFNSLMEDEKYYQGEEREQEDQETLPQSHESELTFTKACCKYKAAK